MEGDITHQPLLVLETRVITFHVVSKYRQYIFFVSSQSTRVPDGQTDGRTHGQTKLRSQDRAGIVAERSKNDSVKKARVKQRPTDAYEGSSINRLQNGIILLIFTI